MKIVILNDTHTGARNASDIFLNYIGRFYSDVFFPYCKENNIKQIIHLGDFYDHRKYINFKALNHSRKTFLEPLRENGMCMDIIPGNHDVMYKNTNELCSLKELLGYFVENVNIVMEPKVMDYAGCKIAMLPWINPENYNDSMKFVETCQASIIGSHLELAGFEMMKGTTSPHGMSPDPFKRFEMVLSGHYHTKSTKDNIYYLGTQFEMTWSDVNDPKFFHVFDTETRELIPVRNTLTIFKKVVYDDKKMDYDTFDVSTLKNHFVKIVVVNKTDLFAFDRFLDRIAKQDVYEIKIAENFEEFLGANVDSEDLEKISDTESLISTYVDAAQTDLNKDVIKNKLRELFVEAQDTELV